MDPEEYPDVAQHSEVVEWLTSQMKERLYHESLRNTSMVVWRPLTKQFIHDTGSIGSFEHRRSTKLPGGNTDNSGDAAYSSGALFHVGLAHAIIGGRWKNWSSGV